MYRIIELTMNLTGYKLYRILFLPFFLITVAFTFIFVPVSRAQSSDVILWTGMERALSLAEQTGKLILIDVYVEWCPYCQRMHSEVYPDSRIIEKVNEYFVPVRIDAESGESLRYLGRSYTQQEFARAMNYQETPTTYFMNKDGEIVGSQPGYFPVDIFLPLLEFVGSGAYLEQTFEQFQSSSEK